MIAIFGGSFDPLHNAHVALLEEVQKKFQFSNIFIVPSRIPPHKQAPVFSDRQRLEMLREVYGNHPVIQISDYELTSCKLSYAIHTIEHFRDQFPQKEITFILGADAYALLPKWFRADDCLRLARFLVVPRAGVARPIVEGRNLFLETELPNISSSQVRELLNKGQSIDSLVPSKVANYLKTRTQK